MRSLEDVKAWLAQDCTGSAETAAAPFWRLLQAYRPETRLVLIRRPVGEVIDSLLAIDTQGAGTFERKSLAKAMRRLDAKLDQVWARWPGPKLTFAFADLNREAVCREIFEFCLPYKFDRAWWERLAPVNIQTSMPALLRYAVAYHAQMDKMTKIAKHVMLADMALRLQLPADELTIQEERFADSYASAQDLIADHLVQVGEAPDAYHGKNLDLIRTLDGLGNIQIVTARSNGRIFGYLMTILSPSLESPKIKMAVQTTFFASEAFHGLGLRLQRASLALLQARGIDEVWFRAGPRGSGPKMGTLYRRLGAQHDGEIYRLNLRN